MAKYAVSEKTHEAIIRATGELVAESGFTNVSIRAIAKRSGVNIGSIHYHFKSKDKLFEALMRHVLEWMWTNHIQKAVDGLDMDTPRGRSRAVRQLVQAHLVAIMDAAKEPWYGRVVFRAMEYGSPLVDIIEKEFLSKLLKVFFALYERCEPQCSAEKKYMLFHLFMGPLLMHANYPDALQKFMGVGEFSAGYLTELEDAMTKQAQCLLGLLPDKEIEA